MCRRAPFGSTSKYSRATSRFKIFSTISTLLKTVYYSKKIYTPHSGASRGGLKRRWRMGFAVISLKHSAVPSTSNAQGSDREQSCTFLVVTVTTPRTQISALSTSLSALSLPPVVRQKLSINSSNMIRTSSVLYLGNTRYRRTPCRMTLRFLT